MPAGCNFMCVNEKCDHYRAGFTINGIWPIGNIEDVIKQDKVYNNKTFKEGIIKLKKSGREFTCICFPNDEDVPYIGYRVQKWCQNCKCIHSYDAMIDEDTMDSDEVIKKANVQSTCSKCNGMRTFYSFCNHIFIIQ